MVLDMCCVLSSGLGRPKNAVVDEFGGWCGAPSANKPTVCPKAAVAAKPAAAAAAKPAATAAVDPWADEKAPGYNWGLKYNA
jgi:hypothetical protein